MPYLVMVSEEATERVVVPKLPWSQFLMLPPLVGVTFSFFIISKNLKKKP